MTAQYEVTEYWRDVLKRVRKATKLTPTDIIVQQKPDSFGFQCRAKFEVSNNLYKYISVKIGVYDIDDGVEVVREITRLLRKSK